MKRVRFETLLPRELLSRVAEPGRVFLPIGSMEWHGPHMAMGMDTENAYAVSLRVAERIGGVVMPPLYIGTEEPRSPETLRRLGFSGDEHIVGMDFPGNGLKSFYWPEDLFEAVARQHIAMLCDMGFSQILVMNGHGADNQKRILAEVCREVSQSRGGGCTADAGAVSGLWRGRWPCQFT